MHVCHLCSAQFHNSTNACPHCWWDQDLILSGSRQRQPGEHLWTLEKVGQRRHAELRESKSLGVDFQVFADGNQFLYGRRFRARDAALRRADDERASREREGWVRVDSSRLTADERSGFAKIAAARGLPLLDFEWSAPTQDGRRFEEVRHRPTGYRYRLGSYTTEEGHLVFTGEWSPAIHGTAGQLFGRRSEQLASVREWLTIIQRAHEEPRPRGRA